MKTTKIILITLGVIVLAIVLAGMYKFNYLSGKKGYGVDGNPSASMANPASEFCIEQGGKLEIKDEENGQVGYCTLPDGSVFEEWEFFRYVNGEGKGTTKTEIFKVGPKKEECMSAFPQECLIVNGDFFYDAIEGFEFEEGYSYEIEVEKKQSCDPNILNDCPQDVGIYNYKLKKVLKKEKWPDFEKLVWANPNSQKLDIFMKDFYKQQGIIEGVYRTASVDLNGDKKSELIVMLEVDELCGTGGCQMIILQETETSYNVISENKEMFGPVQGIAVSENKTGNWKNLYFLFGDGGSAEFYLEAKNKNGTYQTVPKETIYFDTIDKKWKDEYGVCHTCTPENGFGIDGKMLDEKNTEVVSTENNDFVKNCQKENGVILGPNKSLQCAKNGKVSFSDGRESIDISSCKNYDDGCNTCFVKDGKIGGCTLMYCEEELQKAGCFNLSSTNQDLTFVEFKDQAENDTALKNFINLYVAENGDAEFEKDFSENEKTHFGIAKTDLNNDGVKEVFVRIEGAFWCGTGGCSVLLLQKTESTYKIVNEFAVVQGISVNQKEKTNGWKNLVFVVADGGSKETNEVVFQKHIQKYDYLKY